MDKINGLSLPYMGSKKKLASNILDFIMDANPNCKYVYDLFGGGGAISIDAIQRKNINKVFYNEIDEGVSKLLNEVLVNGMSDWMFQPVSREMFNNHKHRNDVAGGLIRTCWSFGNNVSKGYLYSKKIEEGKLLFQDIIVNGNIESMNKINNNYETEVITSKDILFITGESRKQRRLRLTKLIKNLKKERIERIESLEKIEDKIIISSLSYEEVKIDTPIEETVIYLDPPYRNTASYKNNSIDYDFLYNWIEDSEYKIYMSEYDAPFNCVKEFNHRSIVGKNNPVVEKLFCNR